jgi:hypothetical protein
MPMNMIFGKVLAIPAVAISLSAAVCIPELRDSAVSWVSGFVSGHSEGWECPLGINSEPYRSELSRVGYARPSVKLSITRQGEGPHLRHVLAVQCRE